ncbi:4Fe-4S ferredoxin [Limisalsivibrio acetivorans]|uniref:4Fe-4S ferredoxin n=1 Tax=Limisalsivibrio acetivorans TaxID=1304888 RepID=UPI0003B552B3|nr:4Fe-4S ferredoxin [Limisalsivibrio acetivorans]
MELKEQIRRIITDEVLNSPENSLVDIAEKAWEKPVVAFAAGDDPLFMKYREMIGDFYWLPEDAMRAGYPGESFDSSRLSIVCWILPQTDETLKEHRSYKDLPSRRWTLARLYGEEFNHHLRAVVQNSLRDMGYRAVSPIIAEGWDYQQSDKVGVCSNWSERHTAFAAGLGTFGLSDGFISVAGKAIRVGTTVVEADIEPDRRLYTDHTENCLYISEGKCGVCIKRCPVDAISSDGHDKDKCKKYIREVTSAHALKQTGEVVTSCGLCQAGVPCATRIPVKSNRETAEAMFMGEL